MGKSIIDHIQRFSVICLFAWKCLLIETSLSHKSIWYKDYSVYYCIFLVCNYLGEDDNKAGAKILKEGRRDVRMNGKWPQLREEEWHSSITWNAKQRDFREKGQWIHLPGQMFWEELGGGNTHHLCKVFKVGKGNRRFSVLRRELVGFCSKRKQGSEERWRTMENLPMHSSLSWVPRDLGIDPFSK